MSGNPEVQVVAATEVGLRDRESALLLSPLYVIPDGHVILLNGQYPSG